MKTQNELITNNVMKDLKGTTPVSKHFKQTADVAREKALAEHQLKLACEISNILCEAN